MYADVGDAALLTMVDNRFTHNLADLVNGGLHVVLDNGARLEMERNLIGANAAFVRGGLTIEGTDDSQYMLRRNHIVDNQASFGGSLTILNRDALDPLWGISENNLIAGNQGVGVYLEADFRSTNDTIADNGNYGIGMTGAITSTAYLVNTIIWGHTTSIAASSPFTVEAEYSDIEGGWPGVGNIDADPSFVGGGDYHLQDGSPAIDSGRNSGCPAADLDGNPRPYNGVCDMGAYEVVEVERDIYLPLILAQ
jgi:hypothetical protein